MEISKCAESFNFRTTRSIIFGNPIFENLKHRAFATSKNETLNLCDFATSKLCNLGILKFEMNNSSEVFGIMVAAHMAPGRPYRTDASNR